MGMFDSLYVECSKCHEQIEFQSKAGACRLDSYNLSDCPPAIAGDLINTRRQCPCGHSVTLRGAVVLLAEHSS